MTRAEARGNEFLQRVLTVEYEKKYYSPRRSLPSVASLCRSCATMPVFQAVSCFVIVMFRKLIRWKLRAGFGIGTPESLPIVQSDSIPRVVQDELRPYVHSFELAGFQLAFCLAPNIIGRMRMYTVVLLHQTGIACATIAWTQWSLEDRVRHSMLLCCSSFPDNDRALRTLSYPIGDEYAGLFGLMPDDELVLRLSDSTPPGEIATVHFRRIAEYRGEMICSSSQSLADRMLRKTKEDFDRMLSCKCIAPLDAREVRRLQNFSGPGMSCSRVP